mmetsp:Transcript_54491/g.145389  ORF Transcript_54491/g.145389 Transcript_54491/m.145389 type:complete len:228 (+) Transcript_54491:128-811(+)|eukprot:CAMPEP_0194521896 /NCGR_PEP_ID=MMETSP0253-20130528/56332_1 /TAXON_ID=2966 /ORGANISM="Noctiluca scintillans" /LENGTH=227 /DNA_ID=CAMNT_0039366283 /DNA_START=48 /DNA_END=731 /DNA_ORIENTATION=-
MNPQIAVNMSGSPSVSPDRSSCTSERSAPSSLSSWEFGILRSLGASVTGDRSSGAHRTERGGAPSILPISCLRGNTTYQVQRCLTSSSALATSMYHVLDTGSIRTSTRSTDIAMAVSRADCNAGARGFHPFFTVSTSQTPFRLASTLWAEGLHDVSPAQSRAVTTSWDSPLRAASLPAADSAVQSFASDLERVSRLCNDRGRDPSSRLGEGTSCGGSPAPVTFLAKA